MSEEQLVYVGTYTEAIRFGTGEIFRGKGEGIYLFAFDSQRGSMKLRSVFDGIPNPSYLAFDPGGGYAFAVNELKEYQGRATGAVSSFRVDGASGELELLSRKPSGGTDPCHVACDRWGRHILVTNFMSGSVCVLPVGRDGELGEPTDFIQHEGSSADPERQAGPHAHSTVLDAANQFAFVPDLGLDRLVAYRYEAKRGRLFPAATPNFAAKPGAGPRHLAFHPTGRYAYLVNELDSTVVACSYDPATGAFTEIHTVSTLPSGYSGRSTCADIHVSPGGSHVYASNRGHDSIAVYAVDSQSGRLSSVGHASTNGKIPRNFAIDPSGRFLLAANQNSDNIAVFAIDEATGSLTATGTEVEVGSPVCVQFLAPGIAP